MGYVYLGGSFLAEYGNGTTYFVHPDHLGSTRLLTAMDQSLYDMYDYYPFGEAVQGGTGTTHKFTGDDRDPESNLDHTLFRKYSSSLGRWTSPDPAGLAAVDPSNPQSWNRYSYVLNNPTDLVDRSGLYETCIGGMLYDQVDFYVDGHYDSSDFTFMGSCGGNSNSGLYYGGYYGGSNSGGGGSGSGGTSSGNASWGVLKAIKDAVHTVVCAATAPLVDMAHSGRGGAVGLGFGGSIGAGLMWGVSMQGGVQVVADAKGHVGIAFTGGGNPGYGVLGVGGIWGVQVTSSDAKSIEDLGGRSYSGGVSGSVTGIAVAVDASASSSARSITTTVGGGVGGKGTGLAITYTGVPSVLSTDCGTY